MADVSRGRRNINSSGREGTCQGTCPRSYSYPEAEPSVTAGAPDLMITERGGLTRKDMQSREPITLSPCAAPEAGAARAPGRVGEGEHGLPLPRGFLPLVSALPAQPSSSHTHPLPAAGGPTTYNGGGVGRTGARICPSFCWFPGALLNPVPLRRTQGRRAGEAPRPICFPSLNNPPSTKEKKRGTPGSQWGLPHRFSALSFPVRLGGLVR